MIAALICTALAGCASTLLVTMYAVRFSNAAYAAETQAMAARSERDGLRRQLRDIDSQLTAAKAVIRGLQNSLAQQTEIARVATDCGEAIVHEHARLTDALIDACALLEGRPQQWRAVADRYGVPNGAPNIVDALRPRFLHECRQLIAEVQAGAGERATPRQPPVVIERQLRLVAGREARIATADDPLNLTGPVGA